MTEKDKQLFYLTPRLSSCDAFPASPRAAPNLINSLAATVLGRVHHLRHPRLESSAATKFHLPPTPTSSRSHKMDA